ncbi:hypothetical protein DMH02_008355 [Streptomyces sp. WAC 00631]|uniref:hypothetical protein n=1 Tax=Streptomyces sp. WAC 00631 TaxID=2203201 RepID=UPI000F78C713|nr:hypothetical protein [Streptomyces sp. WAC 00631]MCC5033230.1 hypothetical protein [Streptomyces sp. WAC 00631]
MTSRPEAERLREVFTEAARAITPSPVPLTEIARAGAARHRRRVAALAAGCLLLLPAGAAAVHYATSPGASPVRPAAPSGMPPQSAPAETPAQEPPGSGDPPVMRPEERVRVAPGVELWLTAGGLRWSLPGQPDQSRSVTDGNLDLSRPGVTVRSEPVGDRYLHFGVYHGEGAAARVEIATARGTVGGRLLRLPGAPGWGAWYATAPLPERDRTTTGGTEGPDGPGAPDGPDGPDGREVSAPVGRVTVYDTRGAVLAELVPGTAGSPAANPPGD